MSLPRYLEASKLPAGLGGWIGPICMIWHADGEDPRLVEGALLSTHLAPDGERAIWYTEDPRIRRDNRAPEFLRLDAHRPEVMHLLADQIAAGVRREKCTRCDAAFGLGGNCVRRQEGCQGGRGEAGWLAEPAPHVRDFLPRALGGRLDRFEHAAAVLIHWLTVGPVLGVLAPWREPVGARYHERRLVAGSTLRGGPNLQVAIVLPNEGAEGGGWWLVGSPDKLGPRGPQGGDAGMEAADIAACAEGYALLDARAPGGLWLPTGVPRA